MSDYSDALEAFAKIEQPAEVPALPVEQPEQPEVEPLSPDAPEPAEEDDALEPPAEIDRLGGLERKVDMVGSYFAQQQQAQENYARQQALAHQAYEHQKRQEAMAQNPRIMLDSDFYPIAQQVHQMQGAMGALMQAARAQEAQNLRITEQALLQKYPDFDKFVPPSERETAFKAIADRGQWGFDWHSNLERAYKVFAYESVAKARDELSQKREQKRAEQKKAAQAVAPSGAVFQQPAAQRDPYERGYASARAGFLAAMKGV